MKYLLDTNICIYFLNGDQKIAKKIKKIGSKRLSITNGILAELYYGAYKSQKVNENIGKIEAFIHELTVFSDNGNSAKSFGQLKAELKKQGKPTQDSDLLISSIALVNACILVTSNIRHFENIPKLRLEDWRST